MPEFARQNLMSRKHKWETHTSERHV